MFALADFRHKRMARLWQAKLKRTVDSGVPNNCCSADRAAVGIPSGARCTKDLAHAHRVEIVEAYFLPDVAHPAGASSGGAKRW